MFPAESTLVDVIKRSARLLARNGKALGTRPMVLPNAEFFPDRFTFDQSSAEALLERMQDHAGMLDLPIEVRLVEMEGDELAQSHGCGTSCSTPAVAANPNQRVIPDAEGWTLQLSPAELRHPVALTCTLARSLASIFLVENAARPEDIDTPFEVSVDVTATALGFGVLLLEGSHIYAKSCGGPSIAQVTALGAGDLAALFVIFAGVHGHKPRKALSELSTTQRAAVDEALYWAKLQRPILQRLLSEPAALATEPIELLKEHSLLRRLFGRKHTSGDDLERALRGELAVQQIPQGTPRVAKPRSAAHEDLRALVDEAFDTAAK